MYPYVSTGQCSISSISTGQHVATRGQDTSVLEDEEREARSVRRRAETETQTICVSVAARTASISRNGVSAVEKLSAFSAGKHQHSSEMGGLEREGDRSGWE
eukprot:121659-Rhodomonas_salina.4